jgi:hypothetical protein
MTPKLTSYQQKMRPRDGKTFIAPRCELQFSAKAVCLDASLLNTEGSRQGQDGNNAPIGSKRAPGGKLLAAPRPVAPNRWSKRGSFGPTWAPPPLLLPPIGPPIMAGNPIIPAYEQGSSRATHMHWWCRENVGACCSLLCVAWNKSKELAGT